MAEQNSPVQWLSVAEVTLREGNRTHYMVSLARGPGAAPWDMYQVYTSDIPGRAAYTAADLRHFLGQAPKPDILKFDTDPPACLPAMTYREEGEELRWKILRLEEALANTHSALKELMIVAKKMREACREACRTARLMLDGNGHEVVCVEPHLWLAITSIHPVSTLNSYAAERVKEFREDAELLKQRDGLLAALKSAVETIEWMHGCTAPADDEVEKAIREGNAAISSAKEAV